MSGYVFCSSAIFHVFNLWKINFTPSLNEFVKVVSFLIDEYMFIQSKFMQCQSWDQIMQFLPSPDQVLSMTKFRLQNEFFLLHWRKACMSWYIDEPTLTFNCYCSTTKRQDIYCHREFYSYFVVWNIHRKYRQIEFNKTLSINNIEQSSIMYVARRLENTSLRAQKAILKWKLKWPNKVRCVWYHRTVLYQAIYKTSTWAR